MSPTFSPTFLDQTFAALAPALQMAAQRYPGDGGRRQPVHTLYGGAHLYKAGSLRKVADLATASFKRYAPDARTLAEALGSGAEDQLWRQVHERVLERLKACAIEDYRIDFEDGYGVRTDGEEDAAAVAAAQTVASDLAQRLLPPFFGIRIKAFTADMHRRSARTLGLFLETLLRETSGQLPANFVVTLPKVSLVAQVTALATLLAHVEMQHQLSAGVIKVELMIETPNALIDEHGAVPLRRLVNAAAGRCRGIHFGAYDYTAACDVTANEQRLSHPACGFALAMMKVALAGSDLWLANGATSTLPVALHPESPNAGTLSQEQIAANEASVRRAWRLSYEDVTGSLVNGIYQGWDLHPAQIGVRYAAYYRFFLQALPATAARLQHFMAKAAQATTVGDAFDDAATGQGLLNFFLRAFHAGAITEGEVALGGLSIEELRTKSFATILAMRASGNRQGL